MTLIAFVRHGRTAWNDAGRLQGRADPPLSEAGRALLRGRGAPEGFAGAPWYASPLQRAVETARLLGGPGAIVEPRLIEMDFGAYEGFTLAELHERLGEEMAANEARGLDFLPPGGESPRMVRERVLTWTRELAAAGIERAVAVTHKGVIRAVLAAAYDWQMLDKPPVKLDWTAAQLFQAGADGTVRPAGANVPLAHGGEATGSRI